MSVRAPLSSKRVEFHQKVIELCLPKLKGIERLGHGFTIPVDYYSILYRATEIKELIQNSMSAYQSNLDVLLLDFSSNSQETIRQQLIFNSIAALNGILKVSRCRTFILLMPKVLSSDYEGGDRRGPKDSIEDELMRSLSKQGCMIFVLGENGRKIFDPEGELNAATIEVAYRDLVMGLKGDFVEVIKNSLVRRLGHFEGRHTRKDGARCRRFSFRLENCGDALVQGINSWWDSNHIETQAIIYDTRTNPWYEESILAFAEKRKLECYAIDEILRLQELPRRKYSLLLDIVDSGETLERHVKDLAKRGAELGHHILTAISAGVCREIEIGKVRFIVTSLAQMEQESTKRRYCEQCKLKIPFSSDLREFGDTISSYDFWWMVDKIGWDGEPKEEIPKHGFGYEIIPKFPEMIETYGDWLALKMETRLKAGSTPAKIFLIHPDEAGANALSEKLRIRRGLAVVKIPRLALNAALDAQGDWSAIISQKVDDLWVRHLNEIRDGSGQAEAVILDIFNASGMTFSAMQALLKTYGLKVFCYFPFVDRDPRVDSSKYPVAKHCLYEWYGPRGLTP